MNGFRCSRREATPQPCQTTYNGVSGFRRRNLHALHYGRSMFAIDFRGESSHSIQNVTLAYSHEIDDFAAEQRAGRHHVIRIYPMLTAVLHVLRHLHGCCRCMNPNLRLTSFSAYGRQTANQPVIKHPLQGYSFEPIPLTRFLPHDSKGRGLAFMIIPLPPHTL
jgi:hypothetical protein